jgi:tetratricopeptide (TPR) repeat protein
LSLATSYFYQGKYDASEKEARHAFDIVKKLPGTNYYASVTGLLGRIMYKAGRSREGEVLLREALEIRKKNLHRPSDLALAQGTLGECLLTEKRYAEAEPLLVKSYEALKTIQVARSPALEEARGRLDVLYAAWHKPAESLRSR